MPETVNVKCLLIVGDEAEIVADAEDATVPQRYPAVAVAQEADLPLRQLAGAKLTADVGDDDRLTNFRRRA